MASSIASSSIRRTPSNHHLSSIDILLKLTRIGFAQGRAGLRSIYSSSSSDHRLEVPSTFPSPLILDIGRYKEEFEIGSHCITFEAAGGIKYRSIRLLFASDFNHEVNATVLGYDEQQDTNIMAANATSAALMLSDIPWAGPIGVVRVGMIFGDFVINSAMDELKLSDLDLIYACTQDKTLMVDVHAQEVSERDLEAALQLAHSEVRHRAK
ncbi:hypothetical protein MKX03_006667 [Papaver bracteatum]|nr:hypothetical protein MKX03_006667 [Papaver bracteatum]